MTIPGRTHLYRLVGQDVKALGDLLTRNDEPPPDWPKRILTRHPFSEQRRAFVTPTSVQILNFRISTNCTEPMSKSKRRCRVEAIFARMPDNKSIMKELWMKSVPISELN